MRILLIDNGTKYIRKLGILIRKHEVNLVRWHRQVFKNTEKYDMVILSGSHMNIKGNENYFANEIYYAKSTNIPLLGICLGFEIVAYAYKSRLKYLGAEEKGILKINIVKKDPILGRLGSINAWENHRWVVAKLGPDLVGLARSKLGYEIVKHSSKPIYGFQFHPEMLTVETKGAAIFNNLIRLIEKRKNAALL